MAPFSSFADTGLNSLHEALTSSLLAAGMDPDLTTIYSWQEEQHLLLEIEHFPPEVRDRALALRVLQAGLKQLLPSLAWEEWPEVKNSQRLVRVYLKVKNAPQPYGMDSFIWSRTDQVLDPLVKPRLACRKAIVAVSDRAIQLAPKSFWSRRVKPWAGGILTLMANFWNYGVAVLIVVTSGSLAYGVTRPCVVGGCDRLERSQGFHQQALTTLLSSPTAQDILTAQSNLQTALDLLTPIPVWSVHHGSAQASLERYNADLAGLRTILQAQQKAFEAAKLSQAPPHSVERWVTIHLLWQQAIDQLAPLTASSPAYDYVQKKLMVYRTNYDLIGDRIVAEETAEANFNRAIQTAQLARHKIESNDTVGDQETIKLWQRAIKELSLIPQGTLIYAQAQTQLQDYRQQLGQSVNQIKIETASTHSYDQARQAAKMATDNSAKGQWNLAARDWQQALAHLLQIPTDKTAFKNVPTLIETYQTNLRYAQNQAARNQALVGITTALGKICGSANCTVAAENDRIRINLTVPYAQELQQSLSLPRQNSANQVSPGLKQLMAAIIASSHQLNQVVLIYDGTGHFIARYRPDLGGFARDLDNDRT